MNKQTWIGFLLLALFVVFIRAFLLTSTQFVADDALITYRYAENLAAGNGLVYNLGEKVLGTTTPLQTLLVTLAVIIGIPAKLFGPSLNIFCDVLTSFLIVLLFRNHFNRPYFGFFVAFVYAVFPTPWIWSISGMEVSLYAVCLFSSIYFFLGKRFSLSFLFFGLAFLTRIDALVLMVAILMIAVFNREKIGWRPWLVLGLVLAPWILISTWYYGSPVPNSVIAKKVFYGELPAFRSAPFEIIQGFIFGGKTNLVSNLYSAVYMVPFVLLLLFSLIGIGGLFRLGRNYLILPLWMGGYIAFFIVGQTHMHPWYFAPFYAIYIPVVGLGLLLVWEKIGAWLKGSSFGKGLYKGLAVFILVVCTGIVVVEAKILTHYLAAYQKTENFLTDMAFWVKDRTSNGDKVYYSDIGKLGYFSQRYILDSVGIVSPVVTKHYRNRDWIAPIEEVKPQIVLLAETDFRLNDFLNNPEMKKLYQEVKRFDYKKSKHYTDTIYSESASDQEYPIIIAYEKQR